MNCKLSNKEWFQARWKGLFILWHFIPLFFLKKKRSCVYIVFFNSKLSHPFFFYFYFFFRHKAILDYLSSSGFTDSFNSLKSETHNEDFTADPKQKYSGLLEKKWTSVIRLQKKVSALMIAKYVFLSIYIRIQDYGIRNKVSTNARRNQ